MKPRPLPTGTTSPNKLPSHISMLNNIYFNDERSQRERRAQGRAFLTNVEANLGGRGNSEGEDATAERGDHSIKAKQWPKRLSRSVGGAQEAVEFSVVRKSIIETAALGSKTKSRHSRSARSVPYCFPT